MWGFIYTYSAIILFSFSVPFFNSLDFLSFLSISAVSVSAVCGCSGHPVSLQTLLLSSHKLHWSRHTPWPAHHLIHIPQHQGGSTSKPSYISDALILTIHLCNAQHHHQGCYLPMVSSVITLHILHLHNNWLICQKWHSLI